MQKKNKKIQRPIYELLNNSPLFFRVTIEIAHDTVKNGNYFYDRIHILSVIVVVI